MIKKNSLLHAYEFADSDIQRLIRELRDLSSEVAKHVRGVNT